MTTHGFEHDHHNQPLAWKMRPTTLEEVVGQESLVGGHGSLSAMIRSHKVLSSIFYGPPGTGKTTTAQLLAASWDATFIPLSAVETGVPEVKRLIQAAKERRDLLNRGTVVFLDEIHRFNKAQQDVLLPAVENGTVALIGATTENPWIALNSALISRCILVEFHALSEAAIISVLDRAWNRRDDWLSASATMDDTIFAEIAQRSGGDARLALNILERLGTMCLDTMHLSQSVLDGLWAEAPHYHDRGDRHYDLTSAFIKSMRGSDPDAALYWFGRLLAGGEDPAFIMRRVVVHAAEDVGLADPAALLVAESAYAALTHVGLPEARIPMAEAVLYVATAPKSNAVVAALDALDQALKKWPNSPVPEELRDRHYNPKIKKPYRYPHDAPGHFLPDPHVASEMLPLELYQPSANGREAEIQRRLAAWREQRKRQHSQN